MGCFCPCSVLQFISKILPQKINNYGPKNQQLLKDASLSNFSSLHKVIGKSVMLEPFDFPGMLVQQGKEDELVVSESPKERDSSGFRLVAGLNKRNETVSLEAENRKGCFVSSGENFKPGASLKLLCSTESLDAGFNRAASFMIEIGISEYHPISFVAKEAKSSTEFAADFNIS